jgi:glycolate oxidase FAD binding subunit
VSCACIRAREDGLATIAEESITQLAAAVGGEHITFERPACAAFSIDGMVPRCVVYARSGEHVAATLKRASENGLAVVPCGNATKLSIGNLLRKYDVALCLKQMNQVRRYEPDDLTVTVEPGVRLGDCQEFLSRNRLWIPLDPIGGAASTLGGIAASNASGALRLRYGTPRDMLLGMKIATAEGKVIKTGGRVVKNVAGYDLSKLMIGSCGTLGVIVEINLKLYPLPFRRASRCFRATNLAEAREFRRKTLDSPLSPLRMALLDEGGAVVARGAELDPPPQEGFEIWIEFGGSEAVIRRSLQIVEEIAAAAGVTEYRLEERVADEGWNRLADFGAARNGAESVLLKALLPIAKVEEFIGFCKHGAKAASAACACCGQLGAGVVYISLTQEGLNLSALTLRLREHAAREAGALVVLHCPSTMKRDMDVWGTEADDFPLMRKLKESWDPKGTLSPGRFLGRL